jgi:DNA-binding transcriptional regulator YiaG
MTKNQLERAGILGEIMRAEASILAAQSAHRNALWVIAAHLKAKRQKAGLSLREVARRMQFTPAYVSDVELGRRGCPVKFADEYLKAIGIE